MKNAHLRMGKLRFTKWFEDSSTEIEVHLDRFIGEHSRSKGQLGKAHLISVFGNDQNISAIWSAIALEETFTVSGPAVPETLVTLGKDPQTFRGSVSGSGWKRPVRHLIAISQELSQTHLSDDSQFSRSIICDCDPVLICCRLATRFGLPLLPDWTRWFVAELNRRDKIRPLLGLGCSPVVVYGTKNTFMKWISLGLKKHSIFIPADKASLHWNGADGFSFSSLVQPTAPRNPQSTY